MAARATTDSNAFHPGPIRLWRLLLCTLVVCACTAGGRSPPQQHPPTPTSATQPTQKPTRAAAATPTSGPHASAGHCPQRELTLQILGSGGPIADDRRASSSYLLWYQNRAIALVDFGGGAFQRFGAAGGELDELDIIALTHLHTDHSADLPALLKGAYFSRRQRPLAIAGPQGSAAGRRDLFPALDEWINGLFHPSRGIYRYLGGLLDGSDGLFALQVQPLDAAPGQRHTIALGDSPLQVAALGVEHGIVPALAYRLEIAGRRVVFAGDQNADNPAMVQFSHAADVLVAHVAIPPRAGRIARRLHRPPAAWGRLAQAAGAKQLVLSHWMQRSLRRREATVAAIAEHYPGPMTNATDLACIVL